MGETTYKMKKMTALAICAALAVSGCAAPSGNQGSLLEPTQRADDTKTDIQVQKPPAYVYYVKEADLMRADVNSDMVPGVNPCVIMEGIGEGAGPRSYYDAMHPAKDGSFLIFDFEAARDSSTDWRIVAVDPENGKAELVHEAGGQVYTLMCGGKALIHAQEYSEDTGDTVFNLYSYAPGEGRQLLLADIFDFNASKDGSVIAFTRLDPEGGESLYILRNGEETRLADEMGLAGADEGFDNIYGVRYTYGEAYCTLTRIGRDSQAEDILTKEDGSTDYYLDPHSGGVYYLRYGEDGYGSLYYWSDGEKHLLSDTVDRVCEYRQDLECLDGTSMITYAAKEDGTYGLSAAIDGVVSRFATPGIQMDRAGIYQSTITEDSSHIYLAAVKLDHTYQAVESRIYKYGLNDGKLDPSPECVARGTYLDGIQPMDGGIFYTDYTQSADLYCNGKLLLKNAYTDSVLSTDHGGYFAFQEKMQLSPWMLPFKWRWLPKLIDSGNESLPRLMKITTDGSSETFKRNVALCESYAGGLIMLTDCGKSYPYTGTLSFYDGTRLKTIDKGVVVFYPHDEERFVSGIPWSWGKGVFEDSEQ